MFKKILITMMGIMLLAIPVLIANGCSGEEGTTLVKKGDTVKVHYTGKLTNGTVFDSSVNRESLQFTVGNGDVIAGFDKAVTGMKIGQTKTVTIPAVEAYGLHREDMVLVIEREKLPPGMSPEVGQQLQMNQPNGSPIIVTVTAVSTTSVTLDANPPLAGKDLIFEIKVVEIK